MKLCTKVRLAVAPAGSAMRPVSLHAGDTPEIIDISLVDDGHEFGVDAEGFLHIEGRIERDEPRPNADM